MDDFTKKKSGDPLKATEWNEVTKRLVALEGPVPVGSNLGFAGGTAVGNAPHYQRIVEITGTGDEDGLFLCSYRYYDPANPEAEDDWVTAEGEYDLDARGLDISLSEGDKLVAYYDRQRGTFIPCASAGSSDKVHVKLTSLAIVGGASVPAIEMMLGADVEGGGSKWVPKLSEDGTPIIYYCRNVRQSGMANNLAAGTNCVITQHQGVWVISESDCSQCAG